MLERVLKEVLNMEHSQVIGNRISVPRGLFRTHSLLLSSSLATHLLANFCNVSDLGNKHIEFDSLELACPCQGKPVCAFAGGYQLHESHDQVQLKNTPEMSFL